MKKFYLKTLLTFVLSLLFGVQGWADSSGLVAIKTTTLTMGAHSDTQIPADKFSQNAVTAKLSIEPVNYATITSGSNTIWTRDWSNKTSLSYDITDESTMALAKEGKLSIRLGWNEGGTVTVTITSYGAESDIENGGGEGGGGTGGGSDNTPTNTGLTDLGENGLYSYGEHAYSYTGTATTLVEGATINAIGTTTDIQYYLNSNGSGGEWFQERTATFTLTTDDVTKLAQTNYTFWMAAWSGTITKVTITLPDGTVVGEGGNTGGGTTDPEGGEGGGETPTPDDDPEADYSHQNDANGDGVLEPTAETPAFGVKVNYHRYPQKTDVPTIYITTDAGQDVTNLYTTKTETYYTANIVVVDKNGKMKQRNEAVTFRGRGNSTWNSGSKKKPWRLKFPSKTKFLAEYDLSAGAEINNYANAKSWTLLSNVYDKSLMRNALTAELGKHYGLEFCPAYRFVDLVINGQYLGTYQVSDQVQVDPKRVNVSKTGWFIEHSTNTFAEDPYIMPKAGSQDLYVTVKNPETETITAEGESTEAKEGGAYYGMKQWLTQYWTALTNAQYSSETDKYKAWRDQTDLKSLIGWFIIEDLAGNYDGGMANVYAYKEADASKLKFGPLWDLDIAYGNYSPLTNTHFWSAQTQGVGYLFGEMFKDPYFVKALYEQWEEFKNGDELKNFITAKVSEISTLLAQTQAANYNTSGDSFRNGDAGWTLGSNVSWCTQGVNSFSEATSAITSYLLDTTNGRISWIETEYKKQYDALGCASLEDIDIDGDDEEEIDDTPIASTEIEQKIANKQQLTNLATVYLTVPDALNEDGTRKDINSVVFKKDGVADYHKASIEVVDNGTDGTGRQIVLEHDDKLNIKVRGNETAREGVTKLPYRLKFEKDEKNPATGEVVASHKYDLLGNGINGYKKRNWVLLANKNDGTLMHNALAYTIGKAVGMDFCPGYKFVDLVINGEYRGNYQISDHCEVDQNRINVDADNGWYLEANGNSQWEEPFVNPTGLYISIKSPEPDANSAEETQLKNDVLNYFNNCTALFDIWDTGEMSEEKQAALTNPNTGWRKYWDEESLVNYYIGVNVTGNHDGFMTVKMYRNPGEKVKFGPLWDFDTSYGDYDNGETLSEDAQPGSPIFCNFIHKLVQYDPIFVKKIHDKLHEVIDAGLQKKLLDEVDKLEVMLSKSQATENPNQLSGAYASSVEELRTYIKTHLAWLVETIDAKYEAMGGDDIVIPDTPEEGEEEVGPALNIEYTVPDMGFTGGYANYPIPASAFNNKATSALVTVSGAVYIKFVYRLNQWGYSQDALAEYPNNGNIPQTGTYLVEGEMLQRALRGELAVNCDGNSNVVVTVLNYGATEDTPDTDPFNEQGTRKQLTDLPTIYLNADNINGEWLQAAVEVFDKDNKLYQGATWKTEGTSKKGNPKVAVQYQGSGANDSKNSYRLKFNDPIQLMESGLYKQWVLLANDDDPTMLNNALAKELGDAIGMPWTPGYQFVDLYVNGKYMGTYQLTDRVKAEAGRSLVSGGNKDADWQLRFNDDAERQEDGTEDFIAASQASGVNVIYRNPDPKDYTTDEQKATFNGILSAMRTYFNNFFAETATNTFGNISENVDKQQLINWYIAQEILGVYKGFSSIEAYRSVTEGAADNLLHFGPLWDSEKGFGNTGLAPAINMSDLNTTGSHKGLMIEYAAFDKMKSIFNYLWTQDWFKSGVKTKWDAIKTSLPTTLSETITTLKGTIAASQALNAKKWNTASYEDALTATNTYITKRFAYLEKKFNELAGAAHVHSYTAYIDNGDGTHSRKCSADDAVEDGSAERHTLTVSNGKAVCSACHLEIAEVSGTDGEKVYMLDAGTSKVQYITKTSGFTPTANTLYPINEKPEEGTVFNNVYWTINGVNYADNIIVTDGTAWLGNVKVSAKNATYTRAMSASSVWGTVCLPFKTESNDNVTLYQLSESTADNKGNGTMVFTEAGSTGGLTPLVYKKNKASATSVSFKCGAQEETGLVTVKAKEDMNKNTPGKNVTMPSGWQFYGNVKKTQTLTTSAEATPALYYIASNKFWHATGTLDVTPFRAYFSYTPPTAGAAKISMFSISTDDNLATGVTSANATRPLAIFTNTGSVSIVAPRDMKVSIYNANGMLVETIDALKDTEYSVNLAAGIYMVNGLKFVVK